MKILFITMAWPKYKEHNLYSDLMEEFIEHGHSVTVVVANENKQKQKTLLSCENNVQVLRVKTGNIQKTNKYSKVIHSFVAGPQMIVALLKYLKNKKFDLILFSTPPITLSPSVILLKKLYHAKLYLLLKDIWPQDAVDLGGMKKGGLVWWVFRSLEKATYKHSDYIGCMSPANVDYVRKNNKYLKNKKIEVCPNSQKKREFKVLDANQLREKHGIPKDKIIFIFGGNLGKSQGVEFLVDIIQAYKAESAFYFLIIGSGTKYAFISNEIHQLNYTNAKILPTIPRNEFEELVQVCDIGLILLNKNSTVPNFPSRLLPYLCAKIPVIAAVDSATDIGDILEMSSCGAKAMNGDIESFRLVVNKLMVSEKTRRIMGENGYKLFLEKYTTNKSYKIIMSHFEMQR